MYVRPMEVEADESAVLQSGDRRYISCMGRWTDRGRRLAARELSQMSKLTGGKSERIVTQENS